MYPIRPSMNFNRFLFRFAAGCALIWASTTVTFGQGEGWWRGLFKPKSDPIDVHAPASPAAGHVEPNDSTSQQQDLSAPASTPLSPDDRKREDNPLSGSAPDEATSDFSSPHLDLQPGAIVMQLPARLDTLDSLSRINPQPVSGYRLQVFLGDLNAARAERAKLRRITTEPLYLQAMPPSYGLMVGDFHDKWSAERLRMQWSDLYPDALTIPTDINPLQLPEKKPDAAAVKSRVTPANEGTSPSRN